MTNLFIALIGVALVAVCGWAWLGHTDRSRQWARSLYGRQFVLGVGPGMGILVLGGGLLATVAEFAKLLSNVVALIVVLPMLIAVILILAGIVGLMPKWWGPKWYRDKYAGKKPPPWRGF